MEEGWPRLKRGEEMQCGGDVKDGGWAQGEGED